MSYSEQVLCHFWRPHNNRVMADADAVGVAGLPGNGPFMVLYLRLDGDVVTSFEMRGQPMKGWLRVTEPGYASDDQLRDWVDRSVEYARTLPHH